MQVEGPQAGTNGKLLLQTEREGGWVSVSENWLWGYTEEIVWRWF